MIFNASNYYRFNDYKNLLPVALILLVASVSLFYGFFRRRMDLSAHYNYWLRLIQVISFTTLGFLMLGKARSSDYIGVFVFAVLCIVLMFSEKRIFSQTCVYFTDEGIKIPGYYSDHLINWEEISEVIVREDFVTVFNVNQKYLQFQVLQDLSTLEVAKMNAFCREKLGIRTEVEEDSNKEGENKPTINSKS